MSETTKRPTYNAAGLPAGIRERAIAKAAASWCYVPADGIGSFFVDEAKAKRMQAKDGGTVFPPEAAQ